MISSLRTEAIVPDADVWYYCRKCFAYYAVNFENGIVASAGYRICVYQGGIAPLFPGIEN